MREGYKGILKNAEIAISYAGDHLEELRHADEARALWRAWSGFLDQYVKAVAALRRATDTGSSKSWSDKLLQEQRSHPYLQYAFQARDHANHVFEDEKEARERSVSIGDFIRVSGDSSIELYNNRIIHPDGRVERLPDGKLEVKGGRYAGGSIGREGVKEHEHFLVLKDVKTRSGVYRVPNEAIIAEHQAIELGQVVVEWLQAKLQEAEKMREDECESR
ncbi:mechanosensitive ion channel family protein [Roseivivax sp. THAF197b]|uniref:mechanosensitive ion channel family protein n=1 Tax=Roseivivax sp. THAF197b TaxID=2588299 RepID=UPI001268E95E|nr:mechanosensitive ion channel family protein [Roseivivax sp. THAF197b]QFS82349.1 hypothetical protein FIV09_05875 [Roseivivax sp. THAF197b]